MVEQRIGLIIADDSNIMIECFRHWIEDTIKINLIGVVHKTDELLSLIGIEESAIVLTSYQWVLKQGKSTINKVIDDNPKASLALCLSSNNYESIHRLLEMGIKGFFGDLTTKEELIKGLSDIHSFNYYMAPEILTEYINVKKTDNGSYYPERSYLTKREREILELVLAGKNSRDIARKLNISKRTVDGHRANINNKFGVRNTAQLYKKALTYMYTL
jgi:DNA-binding NarL/FixJ family response regulator